MSSASEIAEVTKETQLKQVVALSLANTPEREIAEQLKITRHAVRKLRSSDEFKKLMKEEGDNAIGVVRDQARAKFAGMLDDFLATIHENLKERKLEAARLYAEITGLKQKEEEKQSDTSLTIVMPGAQAPETVIDTTGREVE